MKSAKTTHTRVHVCFRQSIFNSIKVLKILFSGINSTFCFLKIECKIQFLIFDYKIENQQLNAKFNFQFFIVEEKVTIDCNIQFLTLDCKIIIKLTFESKSTFLFPHYDGNEWVEGDRR